jgi:hypothetical protein
MSWFAAIRRIAIWPGDPQDDVDLSAAVASPQQQLVIRIDPATGRLGLFPDDYPPTGPEAWQRDGQRLNDYVFRVPTDGSPLCIGSREACHRAWPGSAARSPRALIGQGHAVHRIRRHAACRWGELLDRNRRRTI